MSWECKRQLLEVLIAGIVVDTVEEHGVARPKVTITYRFGQSAEMERKVRPEEHLLRTMRIPAQPQTLGDHLRLRRLELKLLQKQVAKRLGVNTATILNWETNVTKPYFSYIPGIIEFLGYNPLPRATNWAERLVCGRKVLGITQEALAQRLDVDQSTLARWERGDRQPAGKYAARAERVLAEAEVAEPVARRAG